MKKVCSVLMSFVLMLVLIPNVSADSAPNLQFKTPEALISYLESTTNSLTSVTTIDEYKNAPREKQEKILEYLNDPEFVKVMFTAITTTTAEDNSEQTFFNGDLVISTKAVDNSTSSSLIDRGISTMAVGDTTIIGKGVDATATVLGIDWVKLRTSLEVEIKVVAKDTSVVSRILRHSADVIHNYVPLAQISANPNTPYITSDGHYAYFTCMWEFKEAIYGMVLASKESWIWINKAQQFDGGIINL
ncbi:hypothetical protein [Paenibacillus lentus]|uniref:hypothetical protein n=1 Tax=Paenibacillus lentus TaxID=1338368 RepID=UPI0036D29C58